MSKSNLWMPLHVSDYLADTTHLSVLEHGAYFLLLLTYWRVGALPDDDKVLANIAKCDRKTWSQVGPTVRQFFQKRGEKLHQKRADFERAKTENMRDKKKAAAETRWRPVSNEINGDLYAGEYADADARGNAGGHADTHAEHHADDMPRARQRPIARQSPKEVSKREKENYRKEKAFELDADQAPPPVASAKNPSTLRGTRLSPDWKPDGAFAAFARSGGLNPIAVGNAFRDYWIAKSGKDATKTDWLATWRNWCRRDARWREPDAAAAATGLLVGLNGSQAPRIGPDDPNPEHPFSDRLGRHPSDNEWRQFLQDSGL